MAKEKSMKNLKEVRERLEVLYINMENRMVKPHEGKELANVAGKLISSAKLELEHNIFLKNGKPVPFIACE